MRVCVIGTGYVGLVTGACLAHIGHQVICVDNNEEKVKLMKAGRSPIFEPGLSEIMQSAIESGNIEFTTDLGAGVAHGEILFIAVGTPPLPTGESDTRYVEAVARGIGTHLNGGYKVIVNKSTVPIGSGDWVRMIVVDGVAERQKVLVTAGGTSSGEAVLEKLPAFDVVSNPEFLREGSAVYDTFNPDRIVLGSNNPKAIAMMKELYAPIVERKFAADQSLPPVPILVTDISGKIYSYVTIS
jgi:UDPglucose 6-dehydrogenase